LGWDLVRARKPSRMGQKFHWDLAQSPFRNAAFGAAGESTGVRGILLYTMLTDPGKYQTR